MSRNSAGGRCLDRAATLLHSSTDANEDDTGPDQTGLTRDERRGLTREFVTIGGPALIQLAAEPLAALMDTAYLGRLGPEILGGAGVAISAHYAVSKLYNDPLLRTSISLVASQQPTTTTTKQAPSTGTEEKSSPDAQQEEEQATNELSIAVSSALLLATTVGLVQLVIYTVFCRGITRSMGLTPTSSMWHSAVSYLQLRAVGTPAATLWLVTNGIFRGLGDTTTPLVYSLVFCSLNGILDPLFIFVAKWGASGAAAGTALAQYIALIPLLLALHRRVPIRIAGQWPALKQSLQQYVRAGGLVLVRTVGKVLAYTICARQAAVLGSVAAAAYNLTFQLGVATTQICEAVAVAVQTLLARELSSTRTPKNKKSRIVRHLIQTSLWSGGMVAFLLSLLTWIRRHAVVAGLTTNPAIQQAALVIFPVVLITQVLKGLAYPVNGIVMGGLDWVYSMTVMWMANIACLTTLAIVRQTTGSLSIAQIWWALAAFMATQVVAGLIRVESKTGIWAVLRQQTQSPPPRSSTSPSDAT